MSQLAVLYLEGGLFSNVRYSSIADEVDAEHLVLGKRPRVARLDEERCVHDHLSFIISPYLL
jgi:hypothetical protein